ncbi:MAG: S9 family peptidase [Myxococcales bacterium]|nr:S9 family peptidase [Myxococcales bacterium]
MRRRSPPTTALLALLTACGQPSVPPSATLGPAADADQCEAIRRAGPPATRRDSIVDTLHGVEVSDPYRWLEDVEHPEVQAWMDEQDTYARAELRALPGRDTLRERLRAKIDVASVGLPMRRGDRLFFARHAPGAAQPVWMVREADGRERVLLDPMQLDPHGRVTIRRPQPSPDGRRVAYALSRDGADAATLHIREVDSGRDLPDVIMGARYAEPAWTSDGLAFAYTGLPDDPSIPAPELPSHAELRLHRLGTPAADDPVLYGPLGDTATFVGVHATDQGRRWVLSLHHGWSATDLYLREASAYARGSEGWQPLFVGHPAHGSVSFADGRAFVLTDLDAPRGRVIEIDPADPQPSRWREVVPQREATLQSATVHGGRLLLQYLDHAAAALEIHELDGTQVSEVALPGPTSVAGMAGRAEDPEVFLHLSAMDRAPRIATLDLRDGSLRTWETIEVPVDPHLVLERTTVQSKDGTAVSMFVLHRDDLQLDGDNPTLLTGYGGFGVSLTPGFSPTAALWAELGGVWAMPNLRGGGEYGEAWHDAGRRANKQNTFDDFIAAAEHLVAEGYTRPGRLAIRGGSNGGLLVGAVSTQRPELFGAVLCAVPLLDMIRFHRFGAGPTWIPEYGSPEDPEHFGWLWGYSPLHKVRPGVDYPPLLMLSADNDDRVDPMHARKFVAALQHAGADALLRIERGAGHGGSPRVADRIEAELDAMVFVLDRLGAAR